MSASVAFESPFVGTLVVKTWAGCQVYQNGVRTGYVTKVGRVFKAVRFLLPYMSYRLADSDDKETEEAAIAFITSPRNLAAVMDAS